MNFEDYETLPTQNSITHMTAGAIAGVMEHCVMYPLDSVKVFQVAISIQILHMTLQTAFKTDVDLSVLNYNFDSRLHTLTHDSSKRGQTLSSSTLDLVLQILHICKNNKKTISNIHNVVD